MRRRSLLAGALVVPLAGCATAEDPLAKLWHGGELTIGTGNTTVAPWIDIAIPALCVGRAIRGGGTTPLRWPFSLPGRPGSRRVSWPPP